MAFVAGLPGDLALGPLAAVEIGKPGVALDVGLHLSKVDAIRDGRARERSLAVKEIEKRLAAPVKA